MELNSLNIPLIIFSLGLFGYAVAAFFIWYHLAKFGIGSGPKFALLVFMVGSVALLGLLVILFNRIAWNEIWMNLPRDFINL